jgi:hypothetical protein
MPARVPSELAPAATSAGPNTPHMQAPAYVAATSVNLAQTQPFVPTAQLLASQAAAYAPSAPVQPNAAVAQQTAAVAPTPPAPAPAAPPALSATVHQSLRARVEVTNELGVLRVTLLAPGEAVGPDAYEALLVLTDPNADLLRAAAAE